jgi:hypothetical protein
MVFPEPNGACAWTINSLASFAESSVMGQRSILLFAVSRGRAQRKTGLVAKALDRSRQFSRLRNTSHLVAGTMVWTVYGRNHDSLRTEFAFARSQETPSQRYLKQN